MSLDDRFLDGLLGVAAVINICGVEIVEACFKIRIGHLADLLDIYYTIILRKSHKTESDLGHLIDVYAHNSTS